MEKPSRHDRLLQPLGQRVRALRKARELPVKDLAARAHLSPRFVAKLEAGAGNISVARLADVAAALETSAAALLQGLAVTPRPARAVIAMLGLRGAGKTTIGKLVARRLRRPFFELDQLVEKAAGLPLGQIFDVHGELYFRRVEREALGAFLAAHAAEGDEAVLATGGGIVTEPRTYRHLRAQATTVWLKARAKDHWNRVVAQGDRRPMAENPQAFAELSALLARRSPLYAEAEIIVDTSTLGAKGSAAAVLRSLSTA